MTNILHFPGDCTDFDPDRLMGPDMHGARYLTVSATYDAEDDRTTMQMRPVPPAELNEFISTRRDDTIDRLLDRLQVAELFGGRP